MSFDRNIEIPADLQVACPASKYIRARDLISAIVSQCHAARLASANQRLAIH